MVQTHLGLYQLQNYCFHMHMQRNMTEVKVNVSHCHPGYSQEGDECLSNRTDLILRSDDLNHYVYIQVVSILLLIPWYTLLTSFFSVIFSRNSMLNMTRQSMKA